MKKIEFTSSEMEFILKDEETCCKLHQFHKEQIPLCEGSYADKATERDMISHHHSRAKFWEDHINENIEE
jgi:hypothetical protein